MTQQPEVHAEVAAPTGRRRGWLVRGGAFLALAGLTGGSLFLWSATPENSRNASPIQRSIPGLPVPPQAQLPQSELQQAEPPQGQAAHARSARASELEPGSDEYYEQLLVGEWRQENKGERELVIREDGTAVMTVKLDSYYAVVFGSKLEADIDWNVQEGAVTFTMTGGRPSTAVELVKSMFGEERTQKILEASEEKIVLADVEDGSPDPPWLRDEKTNPAAPKP